MTTKDAFKCVAVEVEASLREAFAKFAESDAYRMLLGDEIIDGKLLSRISAATMSAVMDPTLRDRVTPSRPAVEPPMKS